MGLRKCECHGKTLAWWRIRRRGWDAHYGFGKYAVYPGGNFDIHLIPFTQGAFDLEGETKMASAVMPYYTISWNQDVQNGENVGNSYNRYIITDLLRNRQHFDGVVCTDWGVTGDHTVLDNFTDGKSWGVENLSLAGRHYKILMAGVDQFGGNNDAAPVIEAYQMGVREQGEEKMRARMERSAVRLLKNIFRVGLFENPYLDPEKTKKTVGQPIFMKAGFEARLQSVVLLKNKGNVLPVQDKKTVYVPKRYVPASRNFLGMETPASTEYPVNMDMAKKYFRVTDDPTRADLAVVFIQNPTAATGYDKADVETGGNGYVPISLQYTDYMATASRVSSIAGGDPMEDFTDRGYKNKSTTTANKTDAVLVAETKVKMKGKPVIVSITTSNPMVFSEIEKEASAILVNFGVQDQAVFHIISGKTEPSALLPMQMPLDMETVEKQAEDVPFDLDCYRDSEGHLYDFGYGLNWKGLIEDERASKFR